MIKYSLFDGISKEETAQLRDCLCSLTKIYKKGEKIIQLSTADQSIGLIDSGTAYLIRIDINGNKSIIDYYENGDIFGKSLSPESEMDMYYVMAKEKCTVTFINFHKLIKKCENNCEKHTKLLNNLLMLTLKKSQMHIDVLSQRTIRLKLITYFDYLRLRQNSDSIILPLSLTDLSEYLSVDRSAMMREIKKLKDENIVAVSGNKILLNKNRYT